MKILSQSKKELYELEGNNIFIVDDVIFISNKVNVYSERPGILGQYNSEEECKDVLKGIMENYLDDHIYITEMPKKLEKKEATDENK